MNTYKRSSSITVSWTSGESCLSGSGSNASGMSDAKGGIEIREAKGADVCGVNEACGFQSAIEYYISI